MIIQTLANGAPNANEKIVGLNTLRKIQILNLLSKNASLEEDVIGNFSLLFFSCVPFDVVFCVVCFF